MCVSYISYVRAIRLENPDRSPCLGRFYYGMLSFWTMQHRLPSLEEHMDMHKTFRRYKQKLCKQKRSRYKRWLSTNDIIDENMLDRHSRGLPCLTGMRLPMRQAVQPVCRNRHKLMGGRDAAELI